MEALRELHLFAGAGGGILGGLLLGHVPVCAVELEEYPRKVLLQRQRDGILPWFPIWDDIRTFDGKPWKGRADIVAGGFPCQDISTAGKGAGITGERSGLWKEMARVVCEVEPGFVWVENSPALTGRGLGIVLRDLAEMGFDAVWGVLGADDTGAPHKRKRIWILAHSTPAWEWWQQRKSEIKIHALSNPNGNRCHQVEQSDRGGEESQGPIGEALQSARFGDAPHSNLKRLEVRQSQPENHGEKQPATFRTDWWDIEPGLGRVAHGVANRVDRLKATGNGQVCAVVQLAWKILSSRIVQ
jgi:DNA (cytosine-5)-methyltransferase 1